MLLLRAMFRPSTPADVFRCSWVRLEISRKSRSLKFVGDISRMILHSGFKGQQDGRFHIILYYIILYYIILYYIILYYIILYYIILNYIILYYIILNYIILYYIILYYIILYYIKLNYIILYYTILYYTILYYTILYYTILYYTMLYYTILYYVIGYYHKTCFVGSLCLRGLSGPELGSRWGFQELSPEGPRSGGFQQSCPCPCVWFFSFYYGLLLFGMVLELGFCVESR